MKTCKTQTTIMKISDVDRLDLVNVIFENIKEGTGRLWIECYGKSWTGYWGATGSTLEVFALTTNTDNLVDRMIGEKTTVTDYDKIAREADIGDDLNAGNLFMYQREIESAYGDDFPENLPTTKSRDYVYLTRIVDTIKSALRDDK